MLQENRTQITFDDVQSDQPQREELSELVDWAIGLLRRQYLAVLFVTALGLGLGVIYLGVATPIYTAQTTLYIDLHKNPIDSQIGIFGNDPIEIESQIQILKSKAIAALVIKKLQLIDKLNSAPGFWRSLFGTRSGSSSDSDPTEEMIAQLEGNLTVDAVANSRILTIKYDSSSPEQAAQIANAFANAYITDQLEAKYQANRIATNWLQERQQQLREQADTAQRAVAAFKKQNNIVTTDGKPLDNVQVVDLNTRLTAARAQTTDLLARLDRLQALVRRGPSDTNIDGGIADTNSQVATNLRQQYRELARRESEWSARYGKDHLAVVNLRARMQEIRNSLFEELQRAAEVAENEYEIAKQRQEEIEKQLANTVSQSQSTSPAHITLAGLESTAAAYRKLYDSFLQQYMGSTQQATFPITEARVISTASPPLQRSKPKVPLVLVLSIVMGLGLGIGVGILRDMMDRVFRTGKQLEAELQVPCVALVPLVKDEKQNQSTRNARVHKTIAPVSQVFRTVVDSPLSSFAEAIRSIKLTIDLHAHDRKCKVIGFTSTFPNEGKSTVAAALAYVMAQVGGRVLLVDCDLRNPTLTRMLSRSEAGGVFDVISKRASLTETIIKQTNSNVEFLPAGRRIPLFLTSEVLGGTAINNLFDVLRQNYDYILVDFPPLSPIIDVRASAHFVDAYLLTVEWGRTKIDAVKQSLRSAPNIYDGLIGTVLNKTDMDTVSRYDNSGRYDRHKHYARYGYVD